MDWDEYKAEQEKRKEKNLQDSLDVLHEAAALATKNGLDLKQHSQWHFSLTCYENGERKWRRNIYPSNQRLWWDEKCGPAPYLKLPTPWNLLDIVKKVIDSLPKKV